jgi:hypothetical protein
MGHDIGWLHETPTHGCAVRHHAPWAIHDLRVKQHNQWILTILPQCRALTARPTLTVQKEIQVAVAARAGMTADHLRAAFSVPPVTAGGNPTRVPSPEGMGSSDEE